MILAGRGSSAHALIVELLINPKTSSSVTIVNSLKHDVHSKSSIVRSPSCSFLTSNSSRIRAILALKKSAKAFASSWSLFADGYLLSILLCSNLSTVRKSNSLSYICELLLKLQFFEVVFGAVCQCVRSR